MGNHRFLKLVYDRRRKNSSNGFRGPENERSPLFAFSELIFREYILPISVWITHITWLQIMELKSAMFKIFHK